MFARFGNKKKADKENGFEEFHPQLPSSPPPNHRSFRPEEVFRHRNPKDPTPPVTPSSTHRAAESHRSPEHSLHLQHQLRGGSRPAYIELPETPPHRASRVLVTDKPFRQVKPRLQRKKASSSTTSSNSTLANQNSPAKSRKEASTGTDNQIQTQLKATQEANIKCSKRLEDVVRRLDNVEEEFRSLRSVATEERDKESRSFRERLDKLERAGSDQRLTALERENSILHQELLQAGRFTDELASQIIQNALIQKNLTEESHYMRERLTEVERVNQQLTTALVTLLTQSVDPHYLQDPVRPRSSSRPPPSPVPPAREAEKLAALHRAVSRLSGEGYTYSQCPPVMCPPSGTPKHNYYTLDFTSGSAVTLPPAAKDDGYSSMSCDNTASPALQRGAGAKNKTPVTDASSTSSILQKSLNVILSHTAEAEETEDKRKSSASGTQATKPVSEPLEIVTKKSEKFEKKVEDIRPTSLMRTYYDQTVVNLTASVESTLTWPVLDLETFLSAKDMLEKHRSRLNHHSVCSDSELLTDRFLILSDNDEISTDEIESSDKTDDSLNLAESPTGADADADKREPPPIRIQRKRFTRKRKPPDTETQEHDSLTESRSSSDLTPPKPAPPKPPRKTPYNPSHGTYAYQTSQANNEVPIHLNNNHSKVDHNTQGVTLQKYPSADDLYIDDDFETQQVIGAVKWEEGETSVDEEEVDRQFLDEIRRYQLPDSSLS